MELNRKIVTLAVITLLGLITHGHHGLASGESFDEDLSMSTDIDEGDDTRFVIGRTSPDPNKTCVSVKLPWENEPMYFCADKAKVKYRGQCASLRYGCPPLSNGSLIVATPWDCCPFESKPDHCASVDCPLPPFNRTCIEIPKPVWSAESDVSESEIPSTQECCPKYFCEGSAKHDECHLEVTKPSCIQPPAEKNNCVAFVDSFGCCPKFSCGGGRKPGLCPMELFAMKYNLDQNGTLVERNTTADVNSADTNVEIEEDDEDEEGADGSIGYVSLARYRRECTGDYNCPGKMKCCSMDYRVYSDNSFIKRVTKPVVGFCMDPISKDSTTKFNSKTFDVVM